MALRDILIKIGGDTSHYERSMRDIRLTTRRTTQFINTTWLKVGASIYGAYKIWEAGKMGAKMEQERQSFDNLAASYGRTGESIVNELRKASAETIDMMTLVNSAGKAMMLGIDPDKLKDLMAVARYTSRMTGQEIKQAFEDIATGTARESKMILDNLGLKVSLSEANDKYIKKMGIVGRELTENEKRMAFLNLVSEKGADLINRIGGEALTGAEKMQQMEAAAKDLKAQMSRFASELNTFVAPAMNNVFSTLTDILEIKNAERKFNATELGKNLKEADKLREEMNRLEEQKERRRKWFEKEGKDLNQDRYYSGLVVKYAKAEFEFNKLLANIKSISVKQNKVTPDTPGGETPPPFEMSKSTWDAGFKAAKIAQDNFIRLAKEMSAAEQDRQRKRLELAEDVTEKINALTMDETAFKKWSLDQEVAAMKQAAGDDKRLLDQIKKYHEAALNNISKDTKETFGDEMQTAINGWASNMSGELANALWESEFTFDSIAKSFGKMLTQMILQKKIIEPLINNSGDWFNQAMQWIGGSYNGGSTPSAMGNVFAGRGINAYENKIIDRPVVFPFAKGIGLMGEGTRPEAILPLTRTSSGNLGVEAKVGGGMGNIHVIDMRGSSFMDQGQFNQALDKAISKKIENSAVAVIKNDYEADGWVRQMLGKR